MCAKKKPISRLKKKNYYKAISNTSLTEHLIGL